LTHRVIPILPKALIRSGTEAAPAQSPDLARWDGTFADAKNAWETPCGLDCNRL